MPLPREIASFRFADGAWRRVEPASSVSAGILPERLRIATLNVLADCFPWVVRLAIDSRARYSALADALARLDADVVGLNEVTTTTLDVLLASAYVRTHYHVTEVTGPLANGYIRKHGCVVLSKVPFASVHISSGTAISLDGPARRCVVACVFNSAVGRVAIVSQHTITHTVPENRRLRAQQVAGACELAEELAGGRYVVMGDLNLHYACEDAVVVDNGLVDMWAETRYDAAAGEWPEGWTFDSASNGMVRRYIPGECRRMRLDRILASEGFFDVYRPAAPCAIWADTPVDASRDLWLSDHYGLALDIDAAVDDAADADTTRNPHVVAALRRNAAAAPERSPYTATFAAALPMHAMWLATRALGLR